VFAGSSEFMGATVRGVADWLRAKPAFLLILLILWGGQEVHGQTKVETPQQTNEKIETLANLARAHPVDIAIGAGDILHIDVFDIAELSRDVRVNDTGSISYPLIPGSISAAGLTPIQLEAKLEQLLIENGLVSHPQVSVFVKEQNSQPVTVTGAVAHPVIYQVFRPTTLLEVLAAAGGISDDAGSLILITRPANPAKVKNVADDTTNEPGPDAQTITIQLQDLMASGNSSYNILVFGGDFISIPRAGIVYVLGGGISSPGGYVMQGHGEDLTVLKVVALAHGLAPFSKADDSVIMRTNPATGKRDEIPVHVKQIQNHKGDDVAMKSNDILYIPDSAGKKALARGAETAISIGTAVSIYRVAY
jgi:polysaccharide export outer membrane protein